MLRAVALAVTVVAASACGRFDFGVRGGGGGDASGLRDDVLGDGARDAGPTFACTAGHDEDGDGIDDCNDDCPHVSDATQSDMDGDGVGDACDPNPTQPIDHIRFFDPFVAQRPEWTFTSPPTYAGDAVGFDPGAGTWQMTLALPNVAQHTTWVGGHVDAFTQSPPQRVSLDFTRTADGSSQGCALTEDGSNILDVHYRTAPGSTTSLGGLADQSMSNAGVVIIASEQLPDVSCKATVSEVPVTISDFPIPGGGAPDDAIVIEFDATPVSIDYAIDIVSGA